MTDLVHFTKAPITEALLDIRVKLSNDIDLHALQPIHEAIKEQYPTKKERVSGSLSFAFKGQAAPSVEQVSRPDGYFFTSENRQHILQARLDGFTFSWLRPYDRWDTFRDEARRLWDQYRKAAAPVNITRVALRYINRIDLPLEEGKSLDFDEYLLTRPEISAALPQEMADFFLRVVVIEKKLPAFAVVTQTLQPYEKERKTLPLILDIDVFREASFPCETDEVWTFFEKLRQFKNEVFLKSLTEKTKELFK